VIRLHKTTTALQAVLGGAPATTQPQVTVGYYDVPAQEKISASEYRGAMQVTNTNSTTDVTICAAPQLEGTVRNIDHVCVYNKDSGSVTVTLKLDDGGTETILLSQALATTESLVYERGQGWQVI
jgi:hypothetical protein